jgi:hypothetical protein
MTDDVWFWVDVIGVSLFPLTLIVGWIVMLVHWFA